MRSTIAVTLLMLAWSPAAAQQPPPARVPALLLVHQFVAAETTGAWQRADSLVTDCPDGGTDFQVVTKSVHFLPPFPRRDTLVVPVVYQAAGPFWGIDHSARFSSEPRQDTVSFRVFTDQRGHLWIDCTVESNHVGASYLRGVVELLDEPSRAAWRAARLPEP